MRKLLCVLLVALMSEAGAALAQPYPVRPITLIVPFAAGGPNDVLARIVAEHMSRTLGQQLVIDNVSGAGGTIGSTRAARAATDGYTLLSGNLGTHGASYAYYPHLAYRPGDFAPIGMVAGTPNFVAVRKNFPARTLAQFIDHARNNPDSITAGHAGDGSNGNLVCLLLMSAAGIKLQLVPYRGSGPAMNDLVAGQLDAMCDSAPTVVPQAQAGTIRVLAVAQSERIDLLAEVPTAGEAGLPRFEVTGWNALFAPKETPATIVAALTRALAAALSDPTVQRRILDIGATVPPPAQRGAEWLGLFVKAEIDKWGGVVRTSNAAGR
jgi:tripartite-type tricarboxylate transporter receptor subunit TctC